MGKQELEYLCPLKPTDLLQKKHILFFICAFLGANLLSNNLWALKKKNPFTAQTLLSLVHPEQQERPLLLGTESGQQHQINISSLQKNDKIKGKPIALLVKKDLHRQCKPTKKIFFRWTYFRLTHSGLKPYIQADEDLHLTFWENQENFEHAPDFTSYNRNSPTYSGMDIRRKKLCPLLKFEYEPSLYQAAEIQKAHLSYLFRLKPF